MKAIPIERVQARLAEIDRRLAAFEQLRTERDVLMALLKEAVPVRDGNGDARPLRGPTSAVMDLVRTEPGLSQAEVVKRLVGQIKTRGNASRILYSTIANLRNAGKLVRDGNGRLRVAE